MNTIQTGSKYPEGKAVTIKKTFSRETSIRTTIQADRAIIWSLLTGAADYPRWNSTITSLKGEIKGGSTIELKSILDKDRVFKLEIKEFVPQERFVWGDNMGNREFILADGSNGVVFTMTEKIGGLLFPLFAGSIPSFDETFERFAADLKREAEAIQRSEQ